MTGIDFLIVLLVILIIAIVLIFIFQTYNFMSLKSYHEHWTAIYENRKEHFDKYLKYALNNSKESEPLENIASMAAKMRVNNSINEDRDYYRWKDYYIHELRSAGIE